MSAVTFVGQTDRAGLAWPIRLQAGRVLAIDAFRGLTILIMIFVNTLKGVQGMPAWLYHTPEDVNGMTLPDVVFPAFLFAVGMSIPFSITQRLAGGGSPWQLARHVLTRTLGLLVLGVFMVNGEEHYNDEAMPLSEGLWSLLFYGAVLLVWGAYRFQNKRLAALLRCAGVAGLIALALLFRGGEDGEAGLSPYWWGILGRIGWAYLFACAIFFLTRGRLQSLLFSLVACVLYGCLGSLEIVETFPALMLVAGQAENAVHTSIVLGGLVTALIFFDTRGADISQRFSAALWLSIVLFLAGVLLQPFLGLSKDAATPSWALYSSAICVPLFAFLYWLVDLNGAQAWTSFLRPAAASSLLTYLIPDIVWALMQSLQVDWPALLTQGVTGLIWAVTYSFVVLAMAAGLQRMQVKLHL